MTFELNGKKLTASSKWPCSLEAVEPHPLKEVVIFFLIFLINLTTIWLLRALYK